MTDAKLLKMNLLGGMNDYVLNVIGDDDVTDYWQMLGVPDEATEDDLAFIAENEEVFKDVVNCFNRCCNF